MVPFEKPRQNWQGSNEKERHTGLHILQASQDTDAEAGHCASKLTMERCVLKGLACEMAEAEGKRC